VDPDITTAVMIYFAKWCPIGWASVRGCCSLQVSRALGSSHGCAWHLVTASGSGSGKLPSELPFNALLDPPLSEGSLVQMQPVLLGPNNHARSHKPHERNNLVGGETMAVDQIGANEAASTAQAGFAVNSHAPLLDSNRLVGHANEFANQGKRRVPSSKIISMCWIPMDSK
jgi:hypothetical protein